MRAAGASGGPQRTLAVLAECWLASQHSKPSPHKGYIYIYIYMLVCWFFFSCFFLSLFFLYHGGTLTPKRPT